MKLHLDRPGGHRIAGYGIGYVVVDGERVRGGVVVTAQTLIRDWGPASVRELTAQTLEALLEHDLEIVLLGTGARQEFPDGAVLAGLLDRGVGVEVMDTPAACRTYNILAAEDRRVGAALIPIA